MNEFYSPQFTAKKWDLWGLHRYTWPFSLPYLSQQSIFPVMFFPRYPEFVYNLPIYLSLWFIVLHSLVTFFSFLFRFYFYNLISHYLYFYSKFSLFFFPFCSLLFFLILVPSKTFLSFSSSNSSLQTLHILSVSFYIYIILRIFLRGTPHTERQ